MSVKFGLGNIARQLQPTPMFLFNLKTLLLSKGHEHPHAFLVNLGIDSTTASYYLNNKRKHITLKHLELICVNAFCTPDDFLYWKPSKKEHDVPKHPLQKLANPKVPYLLPYIQQFTPEQLRQLQKAIDEIQKIQ